MPTVPHQNGMVGINNVNKIRLLNLPLLFYKFASVKSGNAGSLMSWKKELAN